MNKFGSKQSQQQQQNPKIKYTPLEQQVVDLKRKYPGVLLVIEVGYKYRFFGEDAKIASKVLHIANFIDRNFYVASIPVHRLSVHVKRLVNAGHKVGVVRQVETAALKAVGNNKNAPFERKLQYLYSKGTFVDEMMMAELDELNASNSSNYLLCLMEQKRGGSGPDEFVQIGIIAIQPSSGDIIYDDFNDGYMRSELETRLLHIEPCELLVPSNMSEPTKKIISYMTNQKSSTNDTIRLEVLKDHDPFCEDYSYALAYVTEFYTDQQKRHQQSQLLSNILKLPDVVIKALAATIRYLKDFELEHAFEQTKQFSHFSSRGHMLLNGNTLVNLEIFRNSTTLTEEGSLFSLLNHTVTRFGRRLLKKWIGRPLVDLNRLEERTLAIDELLNSDNPKIEKGKSLLKNMPDIEKGLCRINYGSSKPQELIHVLDTFLNISQIYQGMQYSEEYRFNSPLLNAIFDTLPTVFEISIRFKSMINTNALNTPDCYVNLLQSDEDWPELRREKQNIAFIEDQLLEHLEENKKILKIPMEYKTVAGIEYLIEIKNTLTKKVPQQWIKISGTKQVSRFHSPYVIEKLKEKERHRERLVLKANEAYRGLLRNIADHYEEFRSVIQSLAQFDCLQSLAAVGQQPNYVKPIFSTETKINVVNGRHPMVERFLGSSSYVPNDIDFNGNGINTMILTGPNMGGKSSYIRQVALISLMAQIGSFVPAESAEVGILDAIYTRMGAADNMLAGESTFMVELHETADIMKQATSKSLVILDELGRGTSTHDGMAIAYSVLQYFITQIQSLTLFVTHYPSLGALADIYSSSTTNAFMSFIEDNQFDIPKVIFLYKLEKGVAKKSYGLNVAYLAGLPMEVLEKAKIKSEEMEESIQDVSNKYNNKSMESIFKFIIDEDIQGLKKSLETVIIN
ncbi:DNA mismatch repair protein Msh3-like protein [Cunninghamella echinulata]|nr:DNA mismatch repair protein Msh3-like protein [Cunninghamella echinulata]